MTSLRESEALHERVRAMVRAYERRASMPEPFDALAADLARFQARYIAGYARLCAARRVDPERLVRAAQAPAVPTDAFRVASVFAFDPAGARATFRTSGTTAGARGVHSMRDVSTYDAAALAFGRRMLAGDRAGPWSVLVLGPSESEVPDSSLAHMCGLFARALAGPGGGRVHFVTRGELDAGGLRARAATLSPHVPAIVLATSFALVHWLDAIGDQVVPLPQGSRVMQTGGFKGRSREVSADALRRAVARAFAIDVGAVVGEYGMTELSSQFWEATLVDRGARPGLYVEPPWARVVPVHAETFEPVEDGAIGVARVEDLANVDSAFAVVAQDRVRRVEGGFELLGRATGAPARGCSIAIDEMLSAAGRSAP